MARIRQVKPEYFLDEELANCCSRDARLLFIGMFNLADREGRLEDRPARMKVQIFPYDDDISPSTISGFLDQLTQGRFIIRYEAQGKRLILIRTFKQHQHFHKDEQPSKLPEPQEDTTMHRASTVQAPCRSGVSEIHPLETGPENQGQTTGNKEDTKIHRTCRPTSTSTSTYTYTSTDGMGASHPETPRRARRTSQKTGCPSVFEPSDSMKEWASSANPSLDLKVETEKFLDWHRAKGNSFADWDAAWRTWIRNSFKFNGNGAAKSSGNGSKSTGACDESDERSTYEFLLKQQYLTIQQDEMLTRLREKFKNP